MILISSSAYVVGEFQVELGEIPPVFLPLGNKKLLEYQVQKLRERYLDEEIYLSLPANYVLSNAEYRLINDLNIVSILVPDYFTLSESISYVLNVMEVDECKSIKIMYGDTLIGDLPEIHENDLLGTSFVEDGYKWHVEHHDELLPLVWCGFYIFSSKQKLLQSLALNRDDFIQAINHYRKCISLKIHIFKFWFDLGHINTYFRSRAQITTQRAFNELRIERGVLHKTGLPFHKIEAEAMWFKNIPSKLKVFTPQLIDQYHDDCKPFYVLEYLPNLPLNEIYVHGRNSAIEWNVLFKKINLYLEVSADEEISSSERKKIKLDFNELVRDKSLSRLKKFAEANNLNLHSASYYGGVELPSLLDICGECISKILTLQDLPGVLHGDLCFSNILYDSRAQNIKVIDPRGMNNQGVTSIWGDQKYDLAKLTHSVIGLYDYIIAGRYIILDEDTNLTSIEFDIDQRVLDIQAYFKKVEFVKGISNKDIMPLVVLLFLSMLPLHDDRPDRQKAMLLNALRLYRDFI